MTGTEPEVVYEVIYRFAVHQEKYQGRIDPRVLQSMNALVLMFGMAADSAWRKLPWWKRLTTDREVWKIRYGQQLRDLGRTMKSSEYAHLQVMLKELPEEL